VWGQLLSPPSTSMILLRLFRASIKFSITIESSAVFLMAAVAVRFDGSAGVRAISNTQEAPQSELTSLSLSQQMLLEQNHPERLSFRMFTPLASAQAK